ncbi:uncharacterized protein SPAPADRAFT_59815, partial [Spathaspora passalidarum NRRL Y-27907]
MSYTTEKKISSAHQFRAPGSTVLPEDAKDLKLVYFKYKTKIPVAGKLKFNLIFCHGTGFNKSVWTYYVNKLYSLCQTGSTSWAIDSVISIDQIGHGDSSLENEGKLGPIVRWDEGGKDVIEVIKHEIATTGDFTNDVNSRNVVIGHSMGGFNALYASFYEPTLIDACVPIEPVIYGEAGGLDKFKKIFGKIAKIMIDKFEDMQEVEFFFKEFSFYKNFHPQVLQDFMEDEIVAEVDPVTKEKKYRLKCKINNQMSAYLGAFMSIAIGMHILSLIRVPIFHVIGKKAVWNPPNSIPWIRSTINPEFLGESFDIPQGEHLVNGERPDEVISIIAKVLETRAEKFPAEAKRIPASSGSTRDQIAEDQFQKLL